MFERFLSDKQVEKRYLESGGLFGEVVSYLYVGECVGFNRIFSKWQKWEAEYAKRGYRTISIDKFIEYGGYGKPLSILGAKRDPNEELILHAQIYKEVYLGKADSSLNLTVETTSGDTMTGTYSLPTTETNK